MKAAMGAVVPGAGEDDGNKQLWALLPLESQFRKLFEFNVIVKQG